jgi:hypothetical protein
MRDNSILTASASVTGVIVFVKALITLMQAMMWFSLTVEQWNALSVFFETVIPIAAVWVGAWWISRHTTSLANPTDIDGTALSRPNDVLPIKKLENLQEQAIKIDKKIEQTRGLE